MQKRYSMIRTSGGNLSVAAIITFVLMLMQGCTTVKDHKFIYVGMNTENLTQEVTVESNPKAKLYLGGKYLGETPMIVPLSYEQTKINLEHRERQIGFGSEKILSCDRHTETFLTPKTYVLDLRAKGYSERQFTVEVPSETKQVTVSLDSEKAVISPIECSILIEARQEHFKAIEAVLVQYVVPDTKVLTDGERRTVANTTLHSQLYTLTLHSPFAFVNLTQELQSLADTRDFTFMTSGAKVQAIYKANELRTGIEMVVHGKGRPGAQQYLIRNGKVMQLSPDGYGNWQQKFFLTEGEKVVQHLSLFKSDAAVFSVFNEINIYKPSAPVVLTRAEFLMKAGLTEQELDSLIEMAKGN